jgi:putative membrane protein
MSVPPPRPRAFRLDDPNLAIDDAPAPFAPTAIVTSEDEAIVAAHAPRAIGAAERDIEKAEKAGVLARRRLTLAGLAWTGLGGLVSLAIGLWTSELIEGLFAKAASLGYVALAFAAIFVAGIIGLLVREIAALMRQNRIAELHIAFAQARARDDREAAQRLVGKLIALYRARPETAGARARTIEAAGGVIDGGDLIDVAERVLLRPLDERAKAEIASAARRVSLVTAISPRAILDVIFVAAQIVRLVRRIAEIYGGRPGLLGFFKLARSIGAHIAITGGMAVGDSLLQQLVGHGVASKISARMGEGVLNGLMTARVGLSAMAVCRPAPFVVVRAPGVNEVAPFLFGGGKDR